MKTSFLAAALLSTTMLAGSALAQTATTTNAAPAGTMWRASKLIGVNVYNDKNEKLGDINELVLDKTGKIERVVIGVGGFLGMGEHDIAVTYDKLRFVNEPVRTTTSDAKTTTRETTTTGSGATTTTTTTTSPKRDAAAWYPDHAVLNADKDQLKAMPQFTYAK